jgi:sec-independent protein translocase protein TatA
MGIKDLFEPFHLLVILVIVMLVFGAGKLPQIGKSMGEAIKGFKEASGTGGSASTATSSTVVTKEATITDDEVAEFKKWQESKVKSS